MIPHNAGLVLVLFLLCNSIVHGRQIIKLPSDHSDVDVDSDSIGTRWAVLIAGSNGYWNYRHQADVCHAYQVLKKGGLKDENIIIFMYDDIAYSTENPRPGIIINNPHGNDVYAGVPKDYTGEDVTVNNFLAVILGNKTALTGGSGKVVNSGPNDHVFIFYTDHGGPGVLGMPTFPYLYADELVETLKKKHASGTYKSLVFYLEACESGSIFEGLLPEGLNIYATTASNAEESSWATYCPGRDHHVPDEYDTCLGDLYSVSWIEDSERHNLLSESLKQQYELVKEETAAELFYGSHVMEFGDKELRPNALYLYMGTNPSNANNTFSENSLHLSSSISANQRDADLIHFWTKFRKAPEGSRKKVEAQKQIVEVMSHRVHLDDSMQLIGKILFGVDKGLKVMQTIQPIGKPLVDDWNCLRTLVSTFEKRCGSLSQYGMKHMRSIANFCNAGVTEDQMAKASAQACPRFPSTSWSSLLRGYSASYVQQNFTV